MPIYAYRCEACGHAKDVLQKVSDAVLTTCPACGAQAFQKQVTAAGFQLKGSGWYVTDFKSKGQNRPVSPEKSEGVQAGGMPGEVKAADGQAGKNAETRAPAPASKSEESATKSADTPAAKPTDKTPSSPGSTMP